MEIEKEDVVKYFNSLICTDCEFRRECDALEKLMSPYDLVTLCEIIEGK